MRRAIFLLRPILIAAFALSFTACGQRDAHPLRGVFVEVYTGTEPPGLLVEHEEVPGFMKAMTMRFEVDRATVATAKQGQRITARMRYGDGKWRLENVRVVESP